MGRNSALYTGLAPDAVRSRVASRAFCSKPPSLPFFMAAFRPINTRPSGHHTTNAMTMAHHGNWNGPSPAWYSFLLVYFGFS